MRLSTRWRVFAAWAGASTVLVLGGGAALYAALAGRYREDHDHEVEETVALVGTLYRVDRAEYGSPAAAIGHVLSELTTPDRSLAAYDAAGRRVAMTRLGGISPDLSHVDPASIGLGPTSRRMGGHDVRLMRTALPDSLTVVVGVSDVTYLERVRFLRLLLATGLPLLLLAGSGLGVMVMRPVLHEERKVAEAQRRFLADAAHELRTPVAVLQAELDAARAAGDDPAALRTAVQASEREAMRLARLVDDLLFLARTDALPPLERAAVFLDDIVQRAVGRVRRLPLADGRPITLDDFEAAPVLGDALLLERAIVVLLENALVHGGTGPIILALEHRQDRVRLAVRDHGPGVPPDAATVIFDRFHQLDPSRPGSGLGLPIARWIAERHGGTLTVEPAAPGARFVLTLPAA